MGGAPQPIFILARILQSCKKTKNYPEYEKTNFKTHYAFGRYGY